MNMSRPVLDCFGLGVLNVVAVGGGLPGGVACESVFDEGHCYLHYAKFGSRVTLSERLGTWPTVRSLLKQRLRHFRSFQEMQLFVLVRVLDHYHIAEASEAVGGSVYNELSRGAAAGDWPRGSLGEALAFLHTGVPDAGILDRRIGGLEPIVPPEQTVEAVTAYNNALVAFFADRARFQPGLRKMDDAPLSNSFVVAQRMERGPNYERNLVNRARRKAAKAGAFPRMEERSAFEGVDDDVRMKLRDSRAELYLLENERRIVEERRKLDRLRSPIRVLKDAMEMVNFAGECAKKDGDNKVAGWAKTISEGYAESIARSAPSSVPSFDARSEGSAKWSAGYGSGSERGNGSKAKVKLPNPYVPPPPPVAFNPSLDETPLNKVEAELLFQRMFDRSKILDERTKLGRMIDIEDFMADVPRYKITTQQKSRLVNAHLRKPGARRGI